MNVATRGERVFEETTFAAGVNHADRHFSKGTLVPLHGLGQRRALFHLPMQIFEDAIESGVFYLAFEDFERPEQGNTALEQIA